MDKDSIKPKTTTFLPPIEKPNGLMTKLAYYFTRRKFGRVITPLKVHAVRLPSAFGLNYEQFWQVRLDSLEAYLEKTKKEGKSHGKKTQGKKSLTKNRSNP